MPAVAMKAPRQRRLLRRRCLTAALLLAASSLSADECGDVIGFSANAAVVFMDATSNLPTAVDLLQERSDSAHRELIARLFARAEEVQEVREGMPDAPAAAAWDRALSEAQHVLRFMAIWADFLRSDFAAASSEQYVEILQRAGDSAEMVNSTLPGGDDWKGLLALSGC